MKQNNNRYVIDTQISVKKENKRRFDICYYKFNKKNRIS